MTQGTAPQRSGVRRWTARALAVGVLAVPVLMVGFGAANAAELPHVDDHEVSQMMSDHGVNVEVGSLMEHENDVDHEKSAKKSGKD